MTDTNAAPAAAAPGRTITLVWDASPDWRCRFHLIYLSDGSFDKVMCQMDSRSVDFQKQSSPFPLKITTKDRAGQDVKISMHLMAAAAPYFASAWCDIAVPGFNFQGIAFQFSATANGPAPNTCFSPWA